MIKLDNKIYCSVLSFKNMYGVVQKGILEVPKIVFVFGQVFNIIVIVIALVLKPRRRKDQLLFFFY